MLQLNNEMWNENVKGIAYRFWIWFASSGFTHANAESKKTYKSKAEGTHQWTVALKWIFNVAQGHYIRYEQASKNRKRSRVRISITPYSFFQVHRC
jgi:hypothetical protein